MQIKHIHKMQTVLDKTIKVAKFAWRHAFVLIVFGMLIAAFVMYQSVDWEIFFIELLIAIGIDKSRAAPFMQRHKNNEDIFKRARDSFNSSDPYNPGSIAWNMRKLRERHNL